MARKGYPSSKRFVKAWQLSQTVEEVAEKLVRRGYPEMNLYVVLEWGRVFRQAGVKLKRMPPPAFLVKQEN